MRIRAWGRGVSVLLAAVLGMTVPAPAAWAGGALRETGVLATGGGESEGVGKEIMLGVFLVVVGILFYLGWQSDRECRAESGPAPALAVHPGDGSGGGEHAATWAFDPARLEVAWRF